MLLRMVLFFPFAVVGAIVGWAAGMAYGHYYGWPVNYDALDLDQHNVLTAVHWIVAGAVILTLDKAVRLWQARRRAAQAVPVIFIGGSSRPPPRKNVWGNVFFVLIIIGIIVAYTMKNRYHH